MLPRGRIRIVRVGQEHHRHVLCAVASQQVCQPLLSGLTIGDVDTDRLRKVVSTGILYCDVPFSLCS